MPENVTAAFDMFSRPAQRALLHVRTEIFRVAETNPVVGPIYETLKWGEPAYLTKASGSGSTIRLASKPAQPDMCGIYLNCNTTLIDRMRDIYPDEFLYQGNRAALFAASSLPDSDALSHCIELALTYHSSKNRKA